jgi:hypothetical protein
MNDGRRMTDDGRWTKDDRQRTMDDRHNNQIEYWSGGMVAVEVAARRTGNGSGSGGRN